MRSPLPLSLIVAAALVPATAHAQDDPKAVIEKGIQARGGAAVLDKYLAGRVEVKGTIRLQDADYPYASQSVYQLPDRMRITAEVTAKGLRNSVTQVFSGGRVSMFVGGLAQQVPTGQVEETKAAMYVQNLARPNSRTILDWLLILGATGIFVVLAVMAKLPHMDIAMGWAVALTAAMLALLATCGIALWRTTRFR